MAVRFVAHGRTLPGVRWEKLDGVDHLVIPCVAVVQGVLNGGLVTMEEIKASLPAWEGVAVTLSHPTQYGEFVSANTKFAIEKYVVGRFFNAVIDGNKFKGEFWINLDKLEKHADRDELLTAVEKGTVIEVSTAYWSGRTEKAGVYDGKGYDHIQVGIIPNHVAILLHEVGACSVADGCGTPRVNQEVKVDIPTSAPCERKTFFERLSARAGDVVTRAFEKLLSNRVSHDMIRKKIHNALMGDEREGTYIFIVDVYDDEVIYGRESPNGEIKVFSRKYTMGDDVASEPAMEDPVEVQQVVTYEPVSNRDILQEEKNMERDQLIEQLATNTAIPFDREKLVAMSDDQLKFLAHGLEPAPVVEPPIKPPVAEPPVVEPPIKPPVAEPLVAEPPVAEPPAPVQNVLCPKVIEALNTMGADALTGIVNAAKVIQDDAAARRESLVSMLIANERCQVPEKALRGMDLEALYGVARTLGVANYAGSGAPVVNKSKEGAGPPPPPPCVLVRDEAKSV